MLDFSRFEILTFDCYGTLINWEDGILRCLHRILAARGKDTDDATILQSYGDFEASAEQGEYRSYREVLQSVVQQFGEQLGFAPTGQEVRSLPESLPRWRPWPDTVSALCEL
jgi:2-haloacid dehalogenase